MVFKRLYAGLFCIYIVLPSPLCCIVCSMYCICVTFVLCFYLNYKVFVPGLYCICVWMNKIGLKNAECVCNYRLRPVQTPIICFSHQTLRIFYLLYLVFWSTVFFLIVQTPIICFSHQTLRIFYLLYLVFWCILVYCIISFEFPGAFELRPSAWLQYCCTDQGPPPAHLLII